MLALTQACPYAAGMDREFGPRLRRLRKARKIAMKELALLAGKSEGWVSRLETNNSDEEPSFSTIVKWCALLGVTTLELTGLAIEDLPRPVQDYETLRLAELGRGVLRLVRDTDAMADPDEEADRHAEIDTLVERLRSDERFMASGVTEAGLVDVATYMVDWRRGHRTNV